MGAEGSKEDTPGQTLNTNDETQGYVEEKKQVKPKSIFERFTDIANFDLNDRETKRDKH